MHLMSVHVLGLHDPHFKKWLPDKEWNLLKLSRTPRSYRNNYYNGILQADDTIRQIFGILEEKGLLERAIVVITADHGEYLGESDYFGHGFKPYEPLVRIPLLVYDMLQSEYPKRSVSSQVDIAPTMLYAIGAPIPTDWSGIPLQLPASRNAVYVASYEVSGVVADYNRALFKYLKNRKNGDEELFNLNNARPESFNSVNKPEMRQTAVMMRELNKLTQKEK